MTLPARIGKYEIESELGRGGMAVVYRARDPLIGRAAAIKVVRKRDLDAEEAEAVLSRFKREAQAAGKLQHPNVVAIYEYGEDEELAWIAMEYVPGQTLRDHLRAGYLADPDRLPSFLEELLEALDYSHAQGVIHRDVKPGNVLVTEMGVAKIGDFGIAHIERSHLTQAGEVLGTPFYMAPEQFDGRPPDERTDIYAAGVIVYETLTGRRPFDGKGGQLMRQIIEAEPPAPSTLRAGLPAAVDAVVAKALAKSPGQRYRTVRELLDALRTAYGRAAQPVPAANLTGALGALRRGLASPPPEGGTARAKAVLPRRRPAALFVDDEERVLNALAFLFREHYEVETATSGAQALEHLRARRYQVLVSDQRMPGMPGVELLRESASIAPLTMRILLTGYSDLAAIVGSVNDGEVFRFIAKPWHEPDLRAAVDEAVNVAIALEAAAARSPSGVAICGAALFLAEPALARAARELAQGAWPVLEAKGVDEALALLVEKDIGVLVCDLDTGTADPTALLRVLKQRSPATQFIIASAASDSELIISLINEARIYRFLRKPPNLSLLAQALAGGLERHARMRRTPELARGESARAGRDSAEARSLLARLRALGGQVARAWRSDPG